MEMPVPRLRYGPVPEGGAGMKRASAGTAPLRNGSGSATRRAVHNGRGAEGRPVPGELGALLLDLPDLRQRVPDASAQGPADGNRPDRGISARLHQGGGARGGGGGSRGEGRRGGKPAKRAGTG